jgi:hypothetical protein
MELIDLAAEKALIWGKRIHRAGIMPASIAFCLGITYDQMHSILNGEIPLIPELELLIREMLSELERQRGEESRHSRRALQQ